MGWVEPQIKHWKSGNWAWESWLRHWSAVCLREGLWNSVSWAPNLLNKEAWIVPPNLSFSNILFVYVGFHRHEMVIGGHVWESAALRHCSIRNEKMSNGGILVTGDPGESLLHIETPWRNLGEASFYFTCETEGNVIEWDLCELFSVQYLRSWCSSQVKGGEVIHNLATPCEKFHLVWKSYFLSLFKYWILRNLALDVLCGD